MSTQPNTDPPVAQVVIEPALHRKVKADAALKGQSIREWVANAIRLQLGVIDSLKAQKTTAKRQS